MNKLIKSKKDRKRIRKLRNVIRGDSQRLRLVFCKTNLYLFFQLINDEKGHTIFCLSTAHLAEKKTKLKKRLSFKNKEHASKLGEEAVKELRKMGIKKVIFDRNGYLYHGKIQAFCEPLHVAGMLGDKKHD